MKALLWLRTPTRGSLATPPPTPRPAEALASPRASARLPGEWSGFVTGRYGAADAGQGPPNPPGLADNHRGDCNSRRARLSGRPLHNASRWESHGRSCEAREPARVRPRQATDRRFRLAGHPIDRPAGARGEESVARSRRSRARKHAFDRAEAQGGDPVGRPGLGARRGLRRAPRRRSLLPACRCSASATAR